MTSSPAEVPPTTFDPTTGVRSKLTPISPDTGVSARLYIPPLPANPPPNHLPLLVYFHGGGFCSGSASTPVTHNYLASLVAKANLLAVSVDYRLAPQHPIPAAFHDSWHALQWVASHASGDGDGWLALHADFGRVFLAGESAGATIAHQMAMRAGAEELSFGVSVTGVVLLHPYFLGVERVESEEADLAATEMFERMWRMVCPASAGVGDPWISPLVEEAPRLWWLGCRRVLVCLAGKDVLRDRGRDYCHGLRASGWGGEVVVVESEGEGHVFHLYNRSGEKALALDRAICAFIHERL